MTRHLDYDNPNISLSNIKTEIVHLFSFFPKMILKKNRQLHDHWTPWFFGFFFFFGISILISKSEFAFPNIENMDKNSLKHQGLN